MVQNRYAGELGRGALGQDKPTAHFIKVVISYACLSSPNACLGVFATFMDKPFGWRFEHANGKQNSVVVNFVLESRLPFAYKSVSFTEKRRRDP